MFCNNTDGIFVSPYTQHPTLQLTNTLSIYTFKATLCILYAIATVLARVGSMIEPSYPTKDAIQGPFSFGASGFLVNNISRASGKHLKRLLFPELLKRGKGRTSAQVDASIIGRSWTKAQLQHYGINFSPELDPFKAKALLLTSVAHGLVSKSTSISSFRAASLTSM